MLVSKLFLFWIYLENWFGAALLKFVYLKSALFGKNPYPKQLWWLLGIFQYYHAFQTSIVCALNIHIINSAARIKSCKTRNWIFLRKVTNLNTKFNCRLFKTYSLSYWFHSWVLHTDLQNVMSLLSAALVNLKAGVKCYLWTYFFVVVCALAVLILRFLKCNFVENARFFWAKIRIFFGKMS